MFDVLTIAALADEFTNVILDGRIQRLGHLDPRTIAIEIFSGGRRRYLIASADNERPRVFLSDIEPSFDSQLVTPFLLLLRKYVRGGFLVAVEQPPVERVLRFSIAKRFHPHNGTQTSAAAVETEQLDDEQPAEDAVEEDGLEDAVFVHLIVEIMGRHSNLILVDDSGRIMESVKRVTSAMSRVRPIQPRMTYVPPPPVDRPDPRRVTAAEMAIQFGSEQGSTQLHRLLTQRLRGMSPQMAKEIAFRVAGRANATIADIPDDNWGEVARETRRLFEPMLTSEWKPNAYQDAEGFVSAFAPVPTGHLRVDLTEIPLESISRAAAMVEDAGDETPIRHAQRRERLIADLDRLRDKVKTRRASLRNEAKKSEEAEQFRVWGETIYGYLWMTKPGIDELVVEDIRIPLDSELSAKENAQRYFEKYRKAQSAGEHLPALLETAEHQLAYLAQLRTLVGLAEEFADLESLREETDALRAVLGDKTGQGRKPKRSTKPKRPTAIVDDRGNAIYIGKTGQENERVTFEVAGPNDTWLHARGVPGSHVIVRWHNAAGDEDERTLMQAAELAAYNSSARTSGSVEVDITRRRYVRKIKGAGPGMVTYRNERTVAVSPKADRHS